MIQYYSVKINVPQMSLVHESTPVETILKQLEYVTKGHIATQTILLNLKQFYSLVPFSSSVL